MTVHSPFMIRQVFRSSKQATVFVLCVALSLSAIAAFSGFSESVNRSLQNDARRFHAADIIIRSGAVPADPLDQAIDSLVGKEQVERARYYEFYSVVRSGDEGASVLADVKIVENGYPFYGEVILKSGEPFHKRLMAGRAVVAQGLLDRLGLRVGDVLKVGFLNLVIHDVVTSEPDRPVNVFSFGPRVFIAADDRDALGLIQKGSRVSYVSLLKVSDPSMVDSIADRLKRAAAERERVDTFRTAGSRFKRFLDNFLFFLKLVGFFIMIIAGIGMQVTLTALLKEKETSIAIMKTMGATTRYVTRHFLLIVFVLGSAGIVLGLLSGYVVQHGLARALTSFLPANMQVSLSWIGILKGILLGFSVVATFTFIPLYRLRETRPVIILRKDTHKAEKRWPAIVSGLLFAAFFSGLVFWHMKDLAFSLRFIGAVSGLILVTLLMAQGMLLMLRRIRIRRLAVRQAARGLFRQGSPTTSIIVTLTTSLCVIFTIYLMEKNLDATFVKSFPPDAPNLFLLDIQPSQMEALRETVGRNITFYPVVRARILAINDVAIDRKKEGSKRRDNFSRVFNLTYRDHLMDNEAIITGGTIFREDMDETPQVSILDMVVEMREMGVGDRILFRIQGVPLEATISSIRTQDMESMSPFFYFVFPAKVLKEAPQTVFAALKVAGNQVSAVQNGIVSWFPNISVIDVSETIKVFSKLMNQLSMIVRFFTLLSISAGVLILISAIFATRAERVVESVYYRVLGAEKPFVFKVFALENMLIGLLSSVLALAMSETAAFFVCRNAFDIPYRFFLPSALLMMAASVLLVVVIGILTSKSILDKKPITFLREQQEA